MADTGVAIEAPAQSPIIFLLGPPGAGKSALGSRACKELGIRFLDLAAKPAANPSTGEIHSDLDRLSSLVADHTADVIELPWPLQHERKAVPRLKIRSGFGRNGTGCREFRHLNRACDEALILVDLPFEEASEVVRDCIAEIREESDASPAEREGLDGWVEDWCQDHSASPRVTKVIVDAMARYLAHLRDHPVCPAAAAPAPPRCRRPAPDADVGPDHVAQMCGSVSSVPPEILANRLELIFNADAARRLAACTAPLLYLQATRDRLDAAEVP